MPSIINKMIMDEAVREFEKYPYIFISAFDGVSVAKISDLRRKLEKCSNRSLVVKHRIAVKAFEKINIPLGGAEQGFKGNVILTMSDKEPQAVSKVLVDYAKENEKFKTNGVIFERKIYAQEFVKSLATLPSRHELLTQVVVRMKSPISGLVLTLGQVIRGLAVALNEIKKKKSEALPAS
ncbi:MAG: 50S ribosomal protein L10 [Candidatus Omnitrophota bacterium]